MSPPRIAPCILSLAVALAGCASTEQRVAAAATADGTVLRSLNVAAVDVRYQAPCAVAVKRQARAQPLACVYVQTHEQLHFLRYDDFSKSYKPAVTMGIGELTSASLANYGFNRQIQLRRGPELLAFQITGAIGVDAGTTAAIHRSLVESGVADAPPVDWIELSDPVPMTITIPVYIGR